jgi:hypothetical protein
VIKVFEPQDYHLQFAYDDMTPLEQVCIDAKDKKAHVYFIVVKPLSKKSGMGSTFLRDTDVPAIEVKSEGRHGIMYCSPSVHKSGHTYQIIGTTVPTVLDDQRSDYRAGY